MSFFGVYNFFQKTNENKSTWGIIIVKSNSFIRFLEETSAWKNHFDFVWPLNIHFQKHWKLRLKLILDTRTENKNTVWKCGIAMEKAWDGTILLVVFQHFSFARLNQSQDAKSYLLYGLIFIPFSHIYLAYCGRALQTKIQFYESLSI